MTLRTRFQPTDASSNRGVGLLQPSTWNDADRTVDVIWSTGAPVERYSFSFGPFIETLDMDPAAIRLDRLNDAGPLLDSHNAYSLGSLLGSVVPGSVRIERGAGICQVQIADTPETADVIAKIRAGHISKVSVGYVVHTYEHIPADDPNDDDELRAVDWEPLEISLVSVPADPGAQLRSRSSTMARIISAGSRIFGRGAVENRGNVSSGSDDHGQAAPPAIIARETDDRAAARGRERAPSGYERRTVSETDIRDMCLRGDVSRSFERQLLEQHAEEPFSRRELADRLDAERQRVRPERQAIDVRERGDGGSAGGRQQRDTFADAVYARLSGREPSEAARELRGASIVDMARALLEESGQRCRFMRAPAVIDAITRAGLHTSSDFGYVLNNAGQRYLIDAYTAAPSPLKVLARKRDFPDFKMRHGVQAEGPANLLNVPENGEFKRVSFVAAENGMKLGTYGNIFGISRQALINDDLGIFADMARFWAQAQANTEADFLSLLITGNGVILPEDNKALYHVDHGNLMATGQPITLSSLSDARKQMRGMKNRDGHSLANVVPKYLVVGPAKETEAEAALTTINATKTSDVNPFGGQLELVVDVRQPGNSWRLFGDPALSPVLEYGNLEGQDGLFTDTRVGFDVDGVEFKARTDIGAGAIDYRGTLMNPGG